MAVRVGYQGNHGTFSEIAVMKYFAGKQAELCGYRSFPEILADLEKGVLDYGMLPVENTTTGVIARTYDLFQSHDVHAVGETVVPIREDLIAVPGTKIEEIREVYSHPEALSQCSGFFEAHPGIQAIAWQDTSAAVHHVAECGDHSKAALGSYRAAEYYQLESLQKDVQDSHTNMTRFLLMSSIHEEPEDGTKISIILTVNHEPGALYHALGILSYADINVTKLESRPIPSEPFHYRFYLDFQGNRNDPFVKTALLKLKEHSLDLKILGCYRAADSQY